MMPSLWISVITFHMIALFFNFKVLLKDSNEIASDKSCHVLESPASFRDCQGKWSLIKCLGSVKKKSLIFLWIFFYPGNQHPSELAETPNTIHTHSVPRMICVGAWQLKEFFWCRTKFL